MKPSTLFHNLVFRNTPHQMLTLILLRGEGGGTSTCMCLYEQMPVADSSQQSLGIRLYASCVQLTCVHVWCMCVALLGMVM